MCVCSLAFATKETSGGGRGREGQTAWGTESSPWYWGEWLWGPGWNAGLPRYAIQIFVSVPVPSTERACTSCRCHCCATWVFLHLSCQGVMLIYFCLCFFLTFALEKLLSKRSRASPAQDEASSQTDIDSVSPSPAPADPGAVAELHKQIEELTSQNAELVLKVQVRQHKCINTQLMHKYLLSHMHRHHFHAFIMLAH